MKSIKVFLVLICLASMGCSSFGRTLKSWVSDDKKSSLKASSAAKRLSYSKAPDMLPAQKRNYKRVTKKTIENTARVDSKAGSLWVNEGQNSYLFTQNIVRMIGDTLVVNLNGEPKQQLQTKARVINDLLQKLQQRRSLASTKAKKTKSGKTEKEKPKTEAPKANQPSEDDVLKVTKVSTRVIERLIDGNYRVKGSQPFMIGKREYKVIVAGIIRSEDFNEDGVDATMLVEPQFDIVSVRKGG